MRKLITFLGCLLCSCVCLFTGCSCKGENVGDGEKYRVELSADILRLYLYESSELTATVYDTSAQTAMDALVEWSVEDASIATFENGTVTAVSVGETYVVAEYEGITSKCRVIVRESEYVPAVQTDKDAMSLLINGDAIDLKSWVFYLDKRYTKDAQFTYEIADEEIASVENDGDTARIKGLQKGETVLTITASWRGVESAALTKTVKIKVTDLVMLDFADLAEKTVYTSEMDGHNKTTKVVPYVKKDDVEVVAPTLTYYVTDENDQPSDLVTVDADGTVRVNEKGLTGVAYIRYKFEGISSASAIRVNVEYPLIDRTQLSVDLEFDNNHEISLDPVKKALNMDDVIGVEGYDCQNGKITDAVIGEYTWKVVHAGYYATAIKVTVCTKIIRTAAELDKMFSEYAVKEKVGALSYKTTSQDVYSYDGYFVLGGNINYGGNVYQNGVMALSLNQCAAGNAVNITPNVGFKGIFDGKGFSISNIAFSSTIDNQFITSSGLFGAIAQTGVVKNLALSVNSLTEKEGASALAALLSGTLDNINVTTPVAGSNSGVRSGCLVHGTYGATLKNVFLNLTGTNGHRYYYGYISHFDFAVNGKATSATNVYVARSHNSQLLVSANMKNSSNPYHSSGSGVFKNVVVYNNAKFSNGTYTDPTGDAIYGEFTNLTFKAYSDLAADTKNGRIVFDDNSFWDLTGDVPAFRVKETVADILPLSYVPVLEIQGNTQIDLSEAKALFMTVNGAKLGDIEVYKSYAGGILTLDSAKIPNSAQNLGKDRTIIISTDNGDYSFKVDIYTAIIDSSAELDKMLSEYAAVASVGKAKRATTLEMFSYDGYFVLGKDIDYSVDGARGVYNSGVSYLRTNYYLSGNLDNTAVINQAGFKGIFDGQGYSISNIEFSTTVNAQDGCFYTGGGLFGAIAQTGVVKNVALKNVALTNVDGNAPIAGNCCGTLDNIAIDMVMEKATDVRTGGVVVGTLGAKLSNIFLHITGNGGHRYRYGYVSVYDHARADGTGSIPTMVGNVYVARTSGTSQAVGQYLVVTQETGEYNPYDDGEMGVFANVKVYDKLAPDAADANYGSGAFSSGVDYQTYAQLATDLAAGNVIVFDNTSYWDFTGIYPTF